MTQFLQEALTFFDKVYFTSPKIYKMPYVAKGMTLNPFDILPSVSSVILLVKAYKPYEDGFAPALCSYYIASNKAYHDASMLCQKYNMIMAHIPIKAALFSENIAAQGINSLAGIDGFGSFFTVQALLSENHSPVKYSSALACPKGCKLCQNACPTGAISSLGLNPSKCTRNYLEYSEMGDKKDKIKMLLGCLECQKICPRNSCELAEMPLPLKSLFSFDSLINEYESNKNKLADVVGRNMVAKGRIRGHALVIAKNLNISGYEKKAEELLLNGALYEQSGAKWYLM